MKPIYNFSADQVSLPSDFDLLAEAEASPYFADGLTPFSMDCTSEAYAELLTDTEETLRTLMGIPYSYKVFFLPGGEVQQFSAVPLNLLSDHTCADYIVTGLHSKSAYLEGKRYGDMAIAASSAGFIPAFSTIPKTKRSDFRPDADYVHICYNNSNYGTRFHEIPDTGNIPLVADLSSCFLSEPLQVSAFGLVYADMRRCLLPAGMTVVLVRADLIGSARPQTPTTLDYQRLLEEGCTYHAPSPICLFAANRLFHRMVSMGGLEEMKRRGERKASLLYDYLDGQAYYTAPADKLSRSMTSVVFTTGNSAMDERFAEAAEAEGLLRLRLENAAHGLCASLHFAIPYEGVERLVSFMMKFALENPKLSI